jgi:DNA-binding YbaB/EbfC family protein
MADFMKLLQQAKEMQERMQRMRDELKAKSVTGAAGGGMVSVEADGEGVVRKVRIDPGVVNPSDVEMLEDLVLIAVSDAQKKAQALAADEMKGMAAGLGLPGMPGGFKLPF